MKPEDGPQEFEGDESDDEKQKKDSEEGHDEDPGQPGGPKPPSPGKPPSGNRFGKLGSLPPVASTGSWKIDRSRTLNLGSSPDDWGEWVERLGDLKAYAMFLVQSRALFPALSWQQQEIDQRELTSRELLLAQEELRRHFKNSPYIRFQSAMISVHRGMLLAQLAIGYLTLRNRGASDTMATDAREEILSAGVIFEALLKPNAAKRIKRLVKWREKPTKEEIESGIAILRLAVDLIPTTSSASPLPAPPSGAVKLSSIEDSVSELARGDPRQLRTLREYSGQLAYVYALQSERKPVSKGRDLAFTYLKLLEAWLNYALAQVFLKDGNIEFATCYGAESSLFLEEALAMTSPPSGSPPTIGGVELPPWEEIILAVRHLQSCLAGLRQRLSHPDHSPPHSN